MKPIPLHYSLKVAENVRKAVNRLNTNSELMRNGTFECFDNCREQGFILSVYGGMKDGGKVAFAQQRNSDDIVVYAYTKSQYPNNLPGEGQWTDRKFFSYNQVEEAAEYILQRAAQFLP